LRIALIEKKKDWLGLVLATLLLALPGCLVRRVTHIHPPERPIPVRNATLAELVAKINSRSEEVRTLTATVDLEPTAGSVYSGVIKEYHDVKGFILLEKPSTIRLLGQAPVVRTNLFDMVSTGDEFRLYIPAKQKFIVGKSSFHRPTTNALENLRPQHIYQSLMIPSIDTDHETPFLEQREGRSSRRHYYVVYIVARQEGHQLVLRRKVWFDRADLELVREQFYNPEGTCTEDVHYAAYQDFQGIHFPTHIELARPVEDYQLTITIEKATFNQPIAPEKFDLKRPAGAELVDISAANPEEKPRGQ
jgi:outer membrane lipoprotein-sorting protein